MEEKATKLFEYEGKLLAQEAGIPVPKGFPAASASEAEALVRKLSPPIVVKSQILVAGRGKAGGIKFAETHEDAIRITGQLIDATIKGEIVERVLLEEKVVPEKELYAAFTVSRRLGSYILIASESGGVDIEEIAVGSPEKIIRYPIDSLEGFPDYAARTACRRLGYTGKQLLELAGILSKLYGLLISYDAELVEINPLMQTSSGNFVAADMKIILDDNALFRQKRFLEREKQLEPELTSSEKEARDAGLAYVELDGNIGIIGNGAGLVMATLDMIKDLGGAPANFCDLGGGAGLERIATALKIVLRSQALKVLFINILGGITRCDDVAKSIVRVRSEIGSNKPIVIRLVGTNEEEGKKILREAGIAYLESMDEAARKTVMIAAGAE